MADKFDDSWENIAKDVQDQHTQNDGGGNEVDKQSKEYVDELDRLLEEHIDGTGSQRAPADGTQQQGGAKGTQKDGKATQGSGQGDGQQQVGDGGQGTGGTQTHSPIPQTPRKYGALFQSDTSGNIIDAAGRKIANSGAERRIFERIHHVYGTMEIEHAQMRQRLEAIEASDTAARDMGLTVEDRAAGLRLMSAWKQDKLKTLNFLLNEAAKANIDVSSIRGGGMDPAAIRTILAEEVQKAVAPFQPFVDANARTAEMEQMRDVAATELNAFYEQFPESRMHAGTIAAIMDKTDMSMRESYFALQAQAAKHGWDMSKPLAEQAQATMARQNGGGNNQRRPTGGGNQDGLPPLNGRGGTGANGTVRTGSRGVASADASWDSIVGDTLTDLGIEH